jgi:hypothetical protein
MAYPLRRGLHVNPPGWVSTVTAEVRAALQLVFGEPRLQVSTARVKLFGASTRLLMDRVIAPPVAPAAHRKRVLPARHVRL